MLAIQHAEQAHKAQTAPQQQTITINRGKSTLNISDIKVFFTTIFYPFENENTEGKCHG